MPATFSINNGQLTESTRKPDIFSVLNDIQDNTQKLISPRDVRDAFLSTWANSPFKITTPNNLSNFEYIGIDSNNPSNKDIKQKIFLGKRSYGNLDIMNNSLLNDPSTDIFLFNTKPDAYTQSSTKIAILAGTNSSLYTFAPYIEASVNQSETGIDLNIINPALDGGAINIQSQTGRVAINNVLFPTVAETAGSASDGRILRYRGTYPTGYLKWEDPTITYNVIGTPGYETNIYGSTVSINGYPIEFIDDNTVPNRIGGIATGSSFSGNSFFNGTTYQNWPVTEVLKELLYPYVGPKLELSAINPETGTNYVEIGKTASTVLTWKLTTYQRNFAESICNYQITPGTSYVGLSFSAVPGTFIGGTISSPTYSNLAASNPASIKTWTFEASDSGNPLVFSYSATASLRYVYPIYYGFTSSIINSTSSLQAIAPTLNKLIQPVSGTISVQMNGEGYLYFIYKRETVGTTNILKRVIDPNGFIMHDIGTYSTPYSFINNSVVNYSTDSTHPSPAYPASYFIWRSNYQCSYPGPLDTSGILGEFKFVFDDYPSLTLPPPTQIDL